MNFSNQALTPSESHNDTLVFYVKDFCMQSGTCEGGAFDVKFAYQNHSDWSYCSSGLNIFVYAIWFPSTLKITKGSAVGGVLLNIKGLGFSSKYNYSCSFVYSEDIDVIYSEMALVEQVSDSLLSVISPAWNHPARVVIIRLKMLDSAGGSFEIPAHDSRQGMFEIQEEILGYTPSIVYSSEGASILLQGAGMDFTSQQVLPPFYKQTSDTNYLSVRKNVRYRLDIPGFSSWNCDVHNSSFVNCTIQSWNFETQQVQFSLTKYWCDSSWNTPVEYNFEKDVLHNLSLSLEFLPEIRRIEPTIGNAFGGTAITILGNGFENVESFCLIKDSANLIQNLTSIFISSTQIECLPTTPFTDPSLKDVLLSFELIARGTTVQSVVDLHFQASDINSAPTFSCQTLVISYSSLLQSYPFLYGISPNSSFTPDEQNQLLSFQIVDIPGFLLGNVSLQDSNLTFTTLDPEGGLIYLKIRIQDDGGIRNGGMNWTEKVCKVYVLPQRSKLQSFEINRTMLAIDIVESEQDERYAYFGFLTDIFYGVLQTYPEFSIRQVSIGPEFQQAFRVPPYLQGGNLFFTTAAYANGNYVLSVVIDQLPQNSRNFSISILSKNQPPEFVLLKDEFVFQQTLVNGSAFHQMFLTNISKGSRFDSFFEQAQTLHFEWWPISDNFPLENFSLYIPPEEPHTGWVKFFIPPCIYGSFYINASLMDDGGNQFHGESAVNFTLHVLVEAVNTPPSFELPTLSLRVCQGSGANEFPGFAEAISKGFCPYEDLEQQASFLVWPVAGGGSDGLISGIRLNQSGTLFFNVSTSGFGKADLYVILMDDGGLANNASVRKMFEIQVVAKHDPPTFSVAEALEFNQLTEDAAVMLENFLYNISHDIFQPPSHCLNQSFLFQFDEDLSLPMYADQLIPASSLGDCLMGFQLLGNGSLQLRASPLCFGVAAMKVTYSERTCFACTNTSQQFNVTIRWVNKNPTFDLNNQTIDECLVCSELEIPNAAVNISAGSVYEDRTQRVSFTIRLLEEQGSMLLDDFEHYALDPNGTLRVMLKSKRMGTAKFSVTLHDDGGVERGGRNISDRKFLQLVVLPVNNRPTFSLLHPLTVLESSGCNNFTQVAFNISAGASNEVDQQLSFQVVSIEPPSLLSNHPCGCSSCPPLSIDPVTGIAIFEVVEHEVGNFTVEVQLQDNGGSERGGENISVVQRLEVVIQPVNDRPSFLVNNFDVYERQELSHEEIPGAAVNISAGISPDEQGQSLTFVVSLLSSSSAPLISDVAMLANGTLLYTLYPRANGLVTLSVVLEDSGGTAHGGSNTSEPLVFNLTILPVNSEPLFDLVNISLWEGTEFRLIDDVARNISAGAVDEAEQQLTFQVEILLSESASFLETAQPSFVLYTNGSLACRLPPYRNGEVYLSVVLYDDGGTANGGINRSVVQRLAMEIEPVNDAPSFEVANVSWYEDSTEHRVLAFNISKGSPYGDEDWQVLTFHVSFTEGSELFERLTVESDGSASYALTANMFGRAVIELLLVDDGGTARNGHNTSLPKQVTITILPVNDPPTFSLYPLDILLYNLSTCTRGIPTIMMDMNAHLPPDFLLIEGFVQNISKGGWHEDDQSLTFFLEPQVSELLLQVPQVSTNGSISIVQNKDASGCLTLSLWAVDSGMGLNTSSSSRFNILVLQSQGAIRFQADPAAFSTQDSLLTAISQSLRYPKWLLSVTTGDNLVHGNVSIRSDLADSVLFEFLSSSKINIPGLQLFYNELIVQQIDKEEQLYQAVLLRQSVEVLEDAGLHRVHILTNITLKGRLRRLKDGLLQSLEYAVRSADTCLEDCFEEKPHVVIRPCLFNETCDASLVFKPSANSYCVCNLHISLVGSSYGHNVTVVVDPLNDVPSFDIRDSAITVYETHEAAGEFLVVGNFAANITAGVRCPSLFPDGSLPRHCPACFCSFSSSSHPSAVDSPHPLYFTTSLPMFFSALPFPAIFLSLKAPPSSIPRSLTHLFLRVSLTLPLRSERRQGSEAYFHPDACRRRGPALLRRGPSVLRLSSLPLQRDFSALSGRRLVAHRGGAEPRRAIRQSLLQTCPARHRLRRLPGHPSRLRAHGSQPVKSLPCGQRYHQRHSQQSGPILSAQPDLGQCPGELPVSPDGRAVRGP
eukprot:749264-Hanusia_phi.AAC.3